MQSADLMQEAISKMARRNRRTRRRHYTSGNTIGNTIVGNTIGDHILHGNRRDATYDSNLAISPDMAAHILHMAATQGGLHTH